MKFVVDQLPYYEDDCPLGPFCWDVNDDENPHECSLLIEQTGESNA